MAHDTVLGPLHCSVDGEFECRLWAGINGSRTLSSETSLEPFAQQPVAPEGFVLQNSLIELDG